MTDDSVGIFVGGFAFPWRSVYHDRVKQDLTAWIVERAGALGLSTGVAVVEPMDPAPLQAWLEAGYGAEMAYLSRHVAARADLTSILPGARSVICAAMPYPSSNPEEPLAGALAHYARGEDYHTELARRLAALWEEIARQAPGATGRCFVDSGPLPERELARRAGVGRVGRHGCLILPGRGSRVVLGEILTTLDLAPTAPLDGDCGSCRRCLEACPTGALVAPGVVDARRCLSYLTIEHKGPIPVAFRSLLGRGLFGCDACQDACPHNAGQPEAAETYPDINALTRLLTITPEEFARRFRGTPLFRTKRRGVLRNACVVLGNLGDPAAVPALARALRDAEPLVRGHAAWALGRLDAGDMLRNALAGEEDPWVREEIGTALGQFHVSGFKFQV